jgi:tetratricopeptide (TPR) repeat protein
MQSRNIRRSATVVVLVSIVASVAPAAAAPEPVAGSTALARADSLWRADARSAAFDELEHLVTLARADGDTASWITGLTRRGQFLKQDDRPAEAESELRVALALATATGDSALACAPRRWLGVALTAQGRNDEAAVQYRRLADLATAVGDTSHAAWAAVGLGWDADLRRDHSAARDHYGHAAALFAAVGDGESELWAQLGEANAWFHLGRYETASRGWDRVAQLASTAGLARHEAITRNNIAGLQFALGRPDISRRHYARAVAIWDSLGQQWERTPPALNLGSCLALLGQVDQARELFLDELAACRSAGFTDYESRAMRKLADLERDQGNLDAAANLYHQALALGDDRPVLERLDAWLGLASLAAAGGDHAGALGSLAVADSLLAEDLTSQARVRLDLARARSLVALDRCAEATLLLDRVDDLLGEARARFGLELELVWADLHEAGGNLGAARAALERAAGIWEQERGLPLDPDWRAERSTAGREVFVRLARHLARDQGVAAAFDRLQQAKARTLREQVRGPSAVDEATDSAQPVDLDILQLELLDDRELLLDAHLSTRGGVLFAVTRDSCRLVDLPTDLDLNRRLLAWRDRLADPSAPLANLTDSVVTLHDDLLGPVAHLLAAADRVILSPDGVLNLVPLAELGPYGDRPWLQVPSVSLWRDLRSADLSGAGDKTITVPPGAPALIVLQAAPTSSWSLPGADWQAANLADSYQGVILRSGALDGSSLADLRGGILHVGAHARSDPRNAWQSAVLLDDGPDGELRAATVAASTVATPLVVLASCSSGDGRVLNGEGVQGLAHAFLMAGARVVVATLWPVDDDQTAVFMAHFYAHLAAGETIGSALAAARAELRAEPLTAHPFAWAGFVLVGDGQLTVPLRTSPPRWRGSGALWLALPVVVVAMMIPWWRRRRGV